jgi:putative Holliday junction resolvase
MSREARCELHETSGLAFRKVARILGIDHGSKRIGLAISDPDGKVALPVGTLTRQGLERDLAAIRELVEARQVERIVVGLPLHMDGRSGREAEAARAFAERLASELGLPVDTIDERWTTREAERALRATGRKGKKKRAVIDSVAAALLLRTYLEREGAD